MMVMQKVKYDFLLSFKVHLGNHAWDLQSRSLVK